ncbi:AprI/Inh family metalloprotease inhibitor [Pseudomonas sp. 25 R 14]|uniref:AprI/Inh family metalloprotease inhibitor n=1 Tax=Pseudomonas sp. 25 R 14 TaxID=1844109 RepID=UPI0011118A9C|nr:AprI/Inh family metalloprotease inhibitor [Pseudomonas sp. 25 R 14]
MASSLVLPSAQQLAGQWSVHVQQNAEQRCSFTLQVFGHALTGGAECLSRWLEGSVAGWIPTPDGIAVVSEEGRKLLFFSRQGDHYSSKVSADLTLLLTRTAP